jgi:hypothetical protein
MLQYVKRRLNMENIGDRRRHFTMQSVWFRIKNRERRQHSSSLPTTPTTSTTTTTTTSNVLHILKLSTNYSET